jgi:signal transduction histidine kinase
MELGRIERMSQATGVAVGECKKLVDDLFRTVRNLALGLRPSMLDDFGLKAALEWQTRDFMGRYPIDVDLRIDGGLDNLPDKYRTCVYRVVQEAMTNCVRHAEAKHVQVAIGAHDGDLEVLVSDDGVGLDEAQRRNGLGLRGIEERVRDLDGTMTIFRPSAHGTALLVRVPLPVEREEALLAGAAG